MTSYTRPKGPRALAREEKERLEELERVRARERAQRQKPPRARVEALLPAWLLEHRANPVAWIEGCLGSPPLWEKQRMVAESVRDARKTLVISGHGTGKTYVAARLALWFLHVFPGAIVVTTATTWSQVRNVLWSEINAAHRAARVPLGSVCSDVRCEVDGKWFALGLSTNESSAFQGFHAERVLVVLDEAQGVHKDIWEASEAITVSRASRILALVNPLSRSTPDYHAAGLPQRWSTIRVSCLEHPNVVEGWEKIPGAVTREWVEERRQEWGEASALYRARVLGEYPEEDDDTLIPLTWLQRALDSDAPEGGDLHLGVDVARYGTDASALVLRAGGDVRGCWTWEGASLMETAGRVLAVMREHGVAAERVHVDVIGLGGGVVDRLREQGHGVDAVDFGGKPHGDWALEVGRETKFTNRRAELYWVARSWFARTAVRLRRGQEKLLADLVAPRYTYDSMGRVKIESKDDIRSRLGRSPDLGDAFVLSLSRKHRPAEVRVPAPPRREAPRPDAEGSYVHQTPGGSAVGKSY